MEQLICTVLIPIYNAAKTLRETVESALQQTYPYLEILLLEDGSSDSSLEIAHSLAKTDSRIRVIENRENKGIVFTRNHGFRQASGKYIALLDADDIWLPEKIELQIKKLQSEDADLCYTAYELFQTEESGSKIYSVPTTVSFNELLKENFIGASTICVKKELALSHPMNPEYAHEDYVFLLDLLHSGIRAVGINQVLMRYRVAANSRSGDKKKASQNRWKIYRNYLGFSRLKSFYYFTQYGWRGVKKHFLP